MRDLIKILIALAFMAMSFFVGKYLANEKALVEYKEIKEIISNDKNYIKQLQDSINILKKKIDTINDQKQLPLSKKIDTKLKGKTRSDNAH